MIKPKRWNKRRIIGLNVPRGNIRATMGRSSRDCVDTRNNYLIPTLSQSWIITLPMLLPMGGWTLRMMSIRSIGWRERSVYLRLCLTRNYRIGWLGTYKVRNVNWVAGLVSWKNHVLNKIWRQFSIFFTPINYIVIVNSRSRWWSTSPSNSTKWRIISSNMEKFIFTPRLTLESFQLQMGFSFPFIRANDLRSSLLIIRALFFNSLLRRGNIRKVSVQLVPKYFSRDCSTDSISCSERKKRKKTILKQDSK